MDLLLDMETGSAMASGLGKYQLYMLPPRNLDNFIVKIMSKLYYYYVISEQKSLDYFIISDIFLFFTFSVVLIYFKKFSSE